MSRRITRTLSAAAVTALAFTGLAATAQAEPSGPEKVIIDDPNSTTVTQVQLLAFNDFHGQLEPSGAEITKSDGTKLKVGGAAYLGEHLDLKRFGRNTSFTVSAGDNVGGSPFLSAAFYDEPAIRVLNAMKVDVSAVGNHEFDAGQEELLRKQNGGCIDDGAGANGKDSCATATFQGNWPWTYVAANITKADGSDLLAPYIIKSRPNGVKVAFVGITLRNTPDIVSQAGIQGLTFEDEIKAANAVVPEIKAKGVKAIVLVLHEGATPTKADGTSASNWDFKCRAGATVSGPAVDINDGLDAEYDVIITGHTHNAYVCQMRDPLGRPRIMTQSLSASRTFTELNMRYNLVTKDFIRAGSFANTVPVTQDVETHDNIQRIISGYKSKVSDLANAQVGTLTGDLIHDRYVKTSTTIGNLIADAQLNDASVVGSYAKPQIAFMNPGGIRNSIKYAATNPPETTDGIVRYEEAFSVQPFGNYVVSIDLTGADIHELLVQQWTGKNAASASYNKFLQVSEGFEYRFTTDAAGQPSLVADSVKLNGVPVLDDASTTYRVVANSFLSDGGDGFAAFLKGTNKYYGGLDLDALNSYLKAHSPYTPNPELRFAPAAV